MEDLVMILGFDEEQEAEELCVAHGLQVTDSPYGVPLKQTTFISTPISIKPLFTA